MDVRTACAKALAEVIGQGRSLSSVIPAWQDKVPARDRALFQELVYGTLRWYGRLDAVLGQLLRKPFKAKDADVQGLLLSGLYQLIYMRVPDHAAVSETVAVTASLKKPWARGLCNAVLRGYQRDHEALLAKVDEDEAAACAHPAWLVGKLRKAYPDRWQAIVTANNERPPMVLRINRRHGDRNAYLSRLQEAGIEASPTPHGDDGLILERPVDVSLLPGFDEGLVSVQDGAAQLAAQLLDLAPGQRVLDACAAPGGKAAHILEREPGLATLVAVESDEKRLARIHDTLGRLSLSAEVVHGDAALPEQWWDGQPFDRILLDAPCSATGVIRRNPDIKLLRRPSDIDALVVLQQRIINALWPLLRPGGMLLYATCSVLPQENRLQLQKFVAEHNDAQEEPLAISWGLREEIGYQLLPGVEGMDGFYYACLRKLPI